MRERTTDQQQQRELVSHLPKLLSLSLSVFVYSRASQLIKDTSMK